MKTVKILSNEEYHHVIQAIESIKMNLDILSTNTDLNSSFVNTAMFYISVLEKIFEED